jgi:hypothetical protein
MSEYLYVPNDDSEYGPIWEASEAREEFTAEELADAQPAELVAMREGARGHYLAATFLDDAADIVDDHAWNDDEVREVRGDMVPMAEGWRRVAAAYNEHGGSYCPEDAAGYGSDTKLCGDCEYIHDDVDTAEGVLSDLGYITTWNDGYVIHRVLDNEEESAT